MSDLISRGATEKQIVDYWLNNEGDITLIDVLGNIRQMPAIERKRGHWIHDDEWECNQCHAKIPDAMMPSIWGVPCYRFCPTCGADLKGV